MGAVSRFYEECAYNWLCPVSPDTVDHIEALIETGHSWLVVSEIETVGYYGPASHDCISLAHARRLIREGLATDEIVHFVEDFGCFAD